jgi:nucleoid DNA-binding protein
MEKMQELVTFIIDLLSKHTCVIIPGFGGFIINEKSAVVNSTENRFFPPQKELIFNTHLSYNDGLLAHALMQEKNISFDKANAIIAESVREAKEKLELYKMYSLGNFGFFSFESTGIIFHEKEIKIKDADAFGLREFYFPTLQSSGKTANIRRISTDQTGIASSVSRAIMGGVAATLALFLFCQPLKNEGRADYASLLPVMISSTETAIRNAKLKDREREESLKTKELDYYLVIGKAESEEEAFSLVGSIDLYAGDSLHILPVNEKYLITFGSSSEFENISNRKEDFYSRYTAFSDVFILGMTQ